MVMTLSRDELEHLAEDARAGRLAVTLGKVTTQCLAQMDEIEALRKQVAEMDEALEDKARLDFLDRCNAALNAHYGTTYRWKMVLNHNVTRVLLGHFDVDLNDAEANGLASCRDAIDEKRRETKAARAVQEQKP